MKNTVILEDIDIISDFFNTNNVEKPLIHSDPEKLFEFYFPDYKNDKPLIIPKKMLEEMRNFGYPRDTRIKFKKIMKSHNPEDRKKGLKLFTVKRTNYDLIEKEQE